ncbi:hypothetical protein DV711_11735 [Motiliproteus coralliicola]|uniref:Solute-binding protein family 3/N-terminal domain-containing protein n=1 Tax=Motiliproteus coralliicola TaxID=2283196 RepID=A0A369WFV7_9GAMM|nr:hypothetical protein [Motiliproteus coralliicola]RDE19554.1 hypothetical protein DV711_11735 [Motiliproteus coralliicola]
MLIFQGTLVADPIRLSSYLEPPFSAQDGRGQVDLLLKEAFKRLDRQAEVEIYPEQRGLMLADGGHVDGHFLRTSSVDELYPNLIRVPVPIYRSSYYAYSLDPDLQIADWEDLKGHQVTYPAGWQVFDSRSEYYGSAVPLHDDGQMAQLIRLQIFDVLLYEDQALSLLLEPELRQRLQRSAVLLESNLYLLLHHRHQSQIAPLAKVLRQMQQDGSWSTLCPECQRSLERH